ncbi:putative arginine--tRNA ligase, mitochondrial [Clavelina lepadiformis]|uniref:putative arginine--tRNA ligase, mitochondrial n=1 Tax=Clavelina lepadiformis TaxID=159417 RepID=UPI004042E854
MLSNLLRRTFSHEILPAIRHYSSTAPIVTSGSEQVLELLSEIYTRGKDYGFHTDYFKNLQQENIIVEYSSPNIAKMFHVGHYRSTVVGNVISGILSAAGHNVCKMNYLGDWGVQFALLALSYKKYGNPTALKEQPLFHLYELYVKISKEAEENLQIKEEAQEVFLDMENGNADALQFWKCCRELSISEYKKLYHSIGVEFDVFSGESMYLDKSREVLEILKEKDLLYWDNGALKMNLAGSKWLSKSPQIYQHPVLARKNGTSLYLTRDVAAAIDRFNDYKFDRMIYVTDISQAEHFNQIFAILEKMGFPWADKNTEMLMHVGFGRIHKMQTRKGNMTFLHDLLEDAYQKAHEDRLYCKTRKMPLTPKDDVTKIVALSGLIYHDLKARLSKGYNFNLEAALASKGSSGLFLQATHCRLCSLEANAGVHCIPQVDVDRILSEPSLVELIEHLNKYTTMTKTLYETLEPCILLRYLFDLCHLTAKALIPCTVKGADIADAQARLLCFFCAKTILGNGLRLMGVPPLVKM